MGRLIELVKDIVSVRENYNAREKFNIWAGAGIGAATPVLAIRYGLLKDAPSIPAWILTSMLCLGPYVPLAGAALGGAIGRLDAQILYDNRHKKLIENLVTD